MATLSSNNKAVGDVVSQKSVMLLQGIVDSNKMDASAWSLTASN